MHLLPLSYFGPIEEYAYLAQNSHVLYEVKEHFVKQSYRNRCIVYGANGLLRLTVPLVLKSREKTAMEDIKISYTENWQARHWKTIQSAYQNSPFFEYYEEILLPVFFTQFEYLIDLNTQTNSVLKQCLQIDCTTEFNSEFSPYKKNDLRCSIHPKKETTLNLPRYIQVFEEKHGFHSNLSVLDLLFNEGPSALLYLKNIPITPFELM